MDTTLSESSFCQVEHLHELECIFDPAIQLAVWRRPADAAIARYCAALTQRSRIGQRQVLAPGSAFDAHWLPELPGRGSLLADIARLSELFAVLVDPPQLGLRLEMLERPMCPKFHVDRVALRMLCTYLGAGTEWVDVQSPADVSAQTPIQTVPTFAVALCKGSSWPGNTSRGLVHRSAAATVSAPRVLLAIDGIWAH